MNDAQDFIPAPVPPRAFIFCRGGVLTSTDNNLFPVLPGNGEYVTQYEVTLRVASTSGSVTVTISKVDLSAYTETVLETITIAQNVRPAGAITALATPASLPAGFGLVIAITGAGVTSESLTVRIF